MPDVHAKLSPSSAHRWLNCRAALAIEQFEPDSTSGHAEEGTAAHQLAENVLRNRLEYPSEYGGCDINTYVGTYTYIYDDKTRRGPQITQEMADKVGEYVEAVWARARHPGAMLMVEHKCDFSHVVGIPDQFGTADAVIIINNELQIHDLKYGYEKVDAFENPQLMIYAQGALEQFSLIADIDIIRMFIHQPRINHVSEYECSVEKLMEFARDVKDIARDVLKLADDAAVNGPDVIPVTTFSPGKKTCSWCKRRGKCQAQAEYVSAALINDFSEIADPPRLEDALTSARRKLAESDSKWLGETLPLIDHIENWCKGVRSAAFNMLQNGHPVPGFKLVQGKQGNRAWRNEDEAIALLRDQFRYKKEEVYTFKVISPAQADKLIKKTNPRRWAKVEALITRPEGKPTLAPESDPEPALDINPANDFEDIEAAESLI